MWSFAQPLLVLRSKSKLCAPVICLFWVFVILISAEVAPNDVHRTARNVIDICDPSKSKFYANVGGSHLVSTKKNNSNVLRCQLQIWSCASCVIVVKMWISSGVLKQCPLLDNADESEYSELCTCDGIEIAEPAYRSYSRRKFCIDLSQHGNASNHAYVHQSQTRSTIIAVTYHREYVEHPLTIEVTAMLNVRHIDIVPDPSVPSSLSGFISTPFFPMQYSSDLRVQYNIKCTPKVSTQCHILLVFTDHMLAASTMLEVLDKKKRIGVFSGRIFRPPIMISEGTALMINFYANKASSYGFRANYSVVLSSETSFPRTTCGGFIRDSSGGAVTMIGIVDEDTVENFDCVWIMRPVHDPDNPRTHLFIKIVEFDDLGTDSELRIHKGPTSQHKLLQRLGPTPSPCISGHVVNANTGFYISLKGAFNVRSRLVIAYATFSYSHSYELESSFSPSHTSHGCYRDTDFQCQNHRCIAHHLQCDGLDHCGDLSDERDCSRNEDGFRDSSLDQKNYYFPNVQTHPGISNGFFFALCASLITFFLCSFICSVVYKIKNQSEVDERLRSVRQIMAEQQEQERFRVENGLVEEAPPQYDYPPSYNDVILYNTMRRMFQNGVNSALNSSLRSTIKNSVECESPSYHLIDNGVRLPESAESSERTPSVLMPLCEPKATSLDDENHECCDSGDDENCTAPP